MTTTRAVFYEKSFHTALHTAHAQTRLRLAGAQSDLSMSSLSERYLVTSCLFHEQEFRGMLCRTCLVPSN